MLTIFNLLAQTSLKCYWEVRGISSRRWINWSKNNKQRMEQVEKQEVVFDELVQPLVYMYCVDMYLLNTSLVVTSAGNCDRWVHRHKLVYRSSIKRAVS